MEKQYFVELIEKSLNGNLTKEEAIKLIPMLNGEIKFVTGINLDAKTAYKMAIESLEKQIPMKVTYEGFCPICKTQYPMYPPSLNKYCSNCGQKLDWN